MPQLQLHDFAPQLIWLAITFIALYFIMARVALPRIATVIEERRDRIASDLDQAEQLRQRTEEAIAAYEQDLSEARGRAHEIAQQARESLAAETEAEKAKVEAQIGEKIAEAEKRITQAKAEALSNLNDVAADAAETVVRELIGAKVTRSEAGKTVSRIMSG